MVTFAAATKNSPSFPTRAPAQCRVTHFVAITCSVPIDSCDLLNADCRTHAQLVSPSRDPIGYVGGFALCLYTGSNPLVRLDASGFRYDVNVTFKHYQKIFSRAGLPGYATTEPTFFRRGKDVIREFKASPCCWCAYVEESQSIDLRIDITLPYGGLFEKDGYTFKGYLEIIGHELRREKVYRDGYLAYLDPMPTVAKKCGMVCDLQQGVAAAKLQKYVSDVFKIGTKSFGVYAEYGQAVIEKENKDWSDYIGLMFNGYVFHETVDPPFPINWPNCPQSTCSPPIDFPNSY